MAYQPDDEILRRLRDEDPARPASPHAAEPDGEREAVRARLVECHAQDGLVDRPGPRLRRRALVLAGALALAGAAIALLTTGGPNSNGPARALAIENTPNGVKLTIEDPAATATEMNQELADAGIDRVRVISVPGSPKHAGTWGGTIDLYAACQGAPTKIGYGCGSPITPKAVFPHQGAASSI